MRGVVIAGASWRCLRHAREAWAAWRLMQALPAMHVAKKELESWDAHIVVVAEANIGANDSDVAALQH